MDSGKFKLSPALSPTAAVRILLPDCILLGSASSGENPLSTAVSTALAVGGLAGCMCLEAGVLDAPGAFENGGQTTSGGSTACGTLVGSPDFDRSLLVRRPVSPVLASGPVELVPERASDDADARDSFALEGLSLRAL